MKKAPKFEKRVSEDLLLGVREARQAALAAVSAAQMKEAVYQGLLNAALVAASLPLGVPGALCLECGAFRAADVAGNVSALCPTCKK